MPPTVVARAAMPTSAKTTPAAAAVAAPAAPTGQATLKRAAPTTAAMAPKGPFTIQLVTFTQAPLAEQERQTLRKRGYQPFLLTNNKFLALCVGSYATRQEAARHLAAFKTSYRDCFVRQR